MISCAFWVGLSAGAAAAPQAATATQAASSGDPDVAFYYGDRSDIPHWALYDWVVVEAERFGAPEALSAYGTQVFAYLSVGEVSEARSWRHRVRAHWVLGRNEAWNSRVMDLRSAGWRRFLVEKVARALWTAGYRAFFLDTMDSHRLFAKDAPARAAQEEGLVKLVRSLRATFPGVKLLSNRGFEVLDKIHTELVGVVGESLVSRWNASRGAYEPVPEADQEWLLARLLEARRRYGLVPVAVDYVAPEANTRRAEVAAAIEAMGVVPWVTDPALVSPGTGRLTSVPRRVLIIYTGDDAQLPMSSPHLYAATPLEYMGYAVDYLSVDDVKDAHPVPEGYAGIVVWLDQAPKRARSLRKFLSAARKRDVPLAIVDRLPFGGDAALHEYGLERVGSPRGPVTLQADPRYLGFEAKPRARSLGLDPVRVRAPAEAPAAVLVDGEGGAWHPVAIMPWGGYALAPFVNETYEMRFRWVLHPFHFFRDALRLQPMPALDLSSESGARLLMVHIDGDGFVNRAEIPGTPFAAEVIYDQIIRKFRLAHTVSVVEGEIGPEGLFPALSPQLEAIARRIFRLRHVELASHAYSHPFQWVAFAQGESGKNVHLELPGYQPSLDREIAGSAAYINERLAPRGKRCEVFLWSGDALPTERALEIADTFGVWNLNGGNTRPTHTDASLMYVYPALRPVGARMQAYAPVMNENVYTGLWTGPYYGFERVIETFERTGAPRRLKPMNIYYHFYSGSKVAAVRALEKVYRWAMAQPAMSQFISEYVPRVHDFYRGELARGGDGAWVIPNHGALRSVRLPRSMGWPDLRRSRGVVGMEVGADGRYLTLAPGQRVRVYFQDKKPTRPYVRFANARVTAFEKTTKGFRASFLGHQPAVVEIANAGRRCTLRSRANDTRYADGGVRLSFHSRATGMVELSCPLASQ